MQDFNVFIKFNVNLGALAQAPHSCHVAVVVDVKKANQKKCAQKADLKVSRGMP